MLNPMLLSRVLAAATLAAAALASGPALAYDRLVVFGDSLSDSGNNAIAIGANGGQLIADNSYVPSQPYALGAYTNANVWVNSFAASLGVPASATPSLALPGGAHSNGGNFAFGGARTTAPGSGTGGFPYSANVQLGMYLGGSITVTPQSLFVIAVGGNDVRAAAETVAPNGSNLGGVAASAAASFASGVGAMVDLLQAYGAANIVVWNAPNVARSPAAIAAGPGAQFGLTTIATAMNTALAARLAGETGVTTFDIFNTFNPVFDNPSAFGLDDATNACGAVPLCDPSKYLFWDGIHPTSAGHALLASGMLSHVTAVPEPASVLMMAVGLGALLLVRRRRA